MSVTTDITFRGGGLLLGGKKLRLDGALAETDANFNGHSYWHMLQRNSEMRENGYGGSSSGPSDFAAVPSGRTPIAILLTLQSETCTKPKFSERFFNSSGCLMKNHCALPKVACIEIVERMGGGGQLPGWRATAPTSGTISIQATPAYTVEVPRRSQSI